MPREFSLTPGQLDEFERRGAVRLPRFYPRETIEAMAERVWADLERRFGLRRGRPETWIGATPAKFQALRKSGAFCALRTPELCDLANALLGEGAWEEPAHWGGLLVTFPAASPILARPPWHLDVVGIERLTPLPVLRIFTFLEPVLPNGGGTLYVSGSHRLAIEIERSDGGSVRSAQVCKRLKLQHPWFACLLAARYGEPHAFKAETRIGDHIVRLEEMNGGPGDLIIMHPAVLHGAAHNALDRPRMMLTEWIMRRGGARKSGVEFEGAARIGG